MAESTDNLFRLLTLDQWRIEPGSGQNSESANSCASQMSTSGAEKGLEGRIGQTGISTVEEPADWTSGIVVVHKSNSSLRICIDPQQLNK